MVSPSLKRRAVGYVTRERDYAQRRACRLLRQPRSTQRYEPKERDGQQRLVRRMQELARKHPRYGYRRMTALLRAEGWRVNHKRVQRLWRLEGLKVPQRQRKRRRLPGIGGQSSRRRAQRPNQVWSYDILFDRTEDGRQLKLLPMVDEFSREGLAIITERRIKAVDVEATLERLFAEKGPPDYIRSDNGGEFIADTIRVFLAQSGVKTLYIEPGSPWENPYIESFNSRFRDELLNRELFTCLAEAQVLVEQFRIEYNTERPHSSLSYMTPKQFIDQWSARCSMEHPADQQTKGVTSPTH